MIRKAVVLLSVVVVLITLLNPVFASSFKYGDVIGNYRGVKVYYNGKAGNGDGYYQCVELVKRFYKEYFKIDTSKWKGNGNQYYPTAKTKGLISFKNGEPEPPQEDDIIAFDGTKWGHVAVITKVDDKYVYFVQQNMYPWSDKLLIKKTGNQFIVSNYGVLWVQGWLRLQNSKPKEITIDPRYLLTFHSVGGVRIGDSIEKAKKVFGEPKEVSYYRAHEHIQDPEYVLDPKWSLTVLEYEGIKFYFSYKKVVLIIVNSPRYRTVQGIGIGSTSQELLDTFSGAQRDELSDAYYYDQIDRRAKFLLKANSNETESIVIGLIEFFEDC